MPRPVRAEAGAAPRGRRLDLAAAAAAAGLAALAAVVGTAVERAEGTLHVDWPPLYAVWSPHAGPGTVPALAVAALVVAAGAPLAARLRWRPLVAATAAASVAWTFALALVDGWRRGIAGRLASPHEYLGSVPRFADAGAALRGFTDHILLTQPDNWPTHVAGHPPGAVLTFVALDRVGLGGPEWAGVWCVVVGGTASAAVLVALGALGAERAARAAAPFLVLAPSAVWAGTSADGYFAAVTAWGLALLALAAARRVRAPGTVAFAAGVLLGWAVYCSYGLVLAGLLAVGVLVCARGARALPFALLGALAVAAAFTAAGFHWWEGYHLLVERYYQGVGSVRPYGYWVWGNLGATVFAVGLAVCAGLRRAVAAAPGALRAVRRGPTAEAATVAVLVAAALCAVALADLSGMSKAETERIWLPFTVWLLPAAALLPGRDGRGWAAAQAALALLVNHLLLTGW
ncbi:hypothetical protein [Allonocardiopsis opalescens]|uniref:Integral membrane protein n=1 Tax=Allonocardiopsis opalescens TaxID=1144618 RepID=A0A2T0Q2V2_9ACTN|nr:hypothetical protein [Allonocardiopsis opalescens]PRX98116.1 hypothetical protein CLV72_105469 [Allonocardiopsis opalescens]